MQQAEERKTNLLSIPQALGNTLNCAIVSLGGLILASQPINSHHSDCNPPFGDLIIASTLIEHVQVEQGITDTLVTLRVVI